MCFLRLGSKGIMGSPLICFNLVSGISYFALPAALSECAAGEVYSSSFEAFTGFLSRGFSSSCHNTAHVW